MKINIENRRKGIKNNISYFLKVKTLMTVVILVMFINASFVAAIPGITSDESQKENELKNIDTFTDITKSDNDVFHESEITSELEELGEVQMVDEYIDFREISRWDTKLNEVNPSLNDIQEDRISFDKDGFYTDPFLPNKSENYIIDQNLPGYVPGEFIVKFKSDDINVDIDEDGIVKTGVSSIDKLNEKYHVNTGERIFRNKDTAMGDTYRLSNIYKFTISGQEGRDVLSLINDYEEDSNVEYAEPNYILNIYEIPDDPLFDEQWALHNIGQSGGTSDADIDAPEAWDIETGDSDVTIAVVDTGVDYLHPDLAENIWINSGEDANNNGIAEGENFNDTGEDGLISYDEPGFDEYNPDPSGDDYDPETNPNGTEGNFIYELGEPFEDFGIDAVGPESPYYIGPDSDGSEGNGVFDPGDKDGIDNDGNGFIDDIRGWDFVGRFYSYPRPDNNPFDEDHFHGTHCSGIISAVTNNGVGIAGVSWNCRIMPLRFMSPSGYTEDAAKAIIYAVDNGADIISMSFGGPFYCNILYEAIEYAHINGVVLIAASGNDNNECPHYPSSYPHVISVAATDHNDEKASFSNYGLTVDVAAPGVNILSTMSSHSHYQYREKSGTSMACPHVAGLAALLLSKNQSLTTEMIETILVNSVDVVESDVLVDSGRINCHKAIQMEPAIALLDTPQNWDDVKDVIEIKGTVWASAFQYYIIEYGRGRNPESWIEITNSSSLTTDGVLAIIDTTLLDDGFYTIRLKLECDIGGIYTDLTRRVVNNEYNLIHVDDDNIQGPWEGTPEHPYQYIQDGADNAGNEDTVFVFNGTYAGEVVVTRPIQLIGEEPTTTVISDAFVGIYVVGEGVNVTGFTFFNNTMGIFLYYETTDCIISQNIVTESQFAGIVVAGSISNTIKDNEVSKLCMGCGGRGIYLVESSDIIVKNNMVIAGTVGIQSIGCNNAIIKANTVIDCSTFSITIESSVSNTVIDNTLISKGIFLWHMWLHPYNTYFWNTHTIENNTMNGKPIRYYKNSSGITVPEDTVQVILANCSYITIENLTSTEDVPNIVIAYSSNITITDNILSNNEEQPGIVLYMSSNNMISENMISSTLYGIFMITYPLDHKDDIISNNIITNNQIGIYLSLYSDKVMVSENVIDDNEFGIVLDGYSQENHILNNNICNSTWLGVYIWYSNNNTIFDNVIYNNAAGIEMNRYSDNNTVVGNTIGNNSLYGIFIEKSNNNILYHNNFINTSWSYAYDYSNNIWNNCELGEGNYWDDYEGDDNDHDGIGDKPYDISGGSNQDLYPLMSLFPLGDINGDGKVNIDDLFLVLGAWGQTGEPGWIPEDVNNDGVINIDDIFFILGHWT